MTEETVTTTTIKNDNSQKSITTVIYALQAVSFFLGFTSVVAVVINYVKKNDVSGTWLESHFRWQIRTFWFALLWSTIGSILAVSGIMLFTGAIEAFFVIGCFLIVANAIWVIYRIVKGWLHLNDGKEMYT